MKCRRCRGRAVVEVRRHNAAFCADCFIRHVREQTRRAIERYDMLNLDDRVLVAVSGGKDSLALWDVLLELGYRASGLYLGRAQILGERLGERPSDRPRDRLNDREVARALSDEVLPAEIYSERTA